MCECVRVCTLGLGVAADDVGVGGDGGLDLGAGEVDHVAIVLEEVDLGRWVGL